MVLDGVPAAILSAAFVLISPIATTARIAPGGYALLVCAGLGAGLLRRAPLAAFAVMLGAAAVFLQTGGPDGPVYLAPLIGAGGIVAAGRGARLWIPAAALSFVVPAIAGRDAGEGISPSLLIGATVWIGAAVALRGLVAMRAAQVAQERAHDLAQERLRIAREVHDVVGHTLAAVSLQAGVAERFVESRPQEARAALRAIRELTGEALDEVRAELGVLRDAGEPAALAPAGVGTGAGGLRAVPGLVATMREAGVRVDLDDRTGDVPLPDRVGAAGFRIVQEALTNVVRHAGAAASARVRIDERDGVVEIEVTDDGEPTASGASDGNGLTGMRERALALGGTLEAGRGPRGGFRVLARLPRRASA